MTSFPRLAHKRSERDGPTIVTNHGVLLAMVDEPPGGVDQDRLLAT